jgi:hypothetical protein
MVRVPSHICVDGLIVPLVIDPEDHRGPAAVRVLSDPQRPLLDALVYVSSAMLARPPSSSATSSPAGERARAARAGDGPDSRTGAAVRCPAGFVRFPAKAGQSGQRRGVIVDGYGWHSACFDGAACW